VLAIIAAATTNLARMPFTPIPSRSVRAIEAIANRDIWSAATTRTRRYGVVGRPCTRALRVRIGSTESACLHRDAIPIPTDRVAVVPQARNLAQRLPSTRTSTRQASRRGAII
jgi:hypothetical protein